MLTAIQRSRCARRGYGAAVVCAGWVATFIFGDTTIRSAVHAQHKVGKRAIHDCKSQIETAAEPTSRCDTTLPRRSRSASSQPASSRPHHAAVPCHRRPPHWSSVPSAPLTHSRSPTPSSAHGAHQQRDGADTEQQRLTINDEAIHIPIAERRVGRIRRGCAERQRPRELLDTAQYDSQCVTGWLTKMQEKPPAKCAIVGAEKSSAIIARESTIGAC